jgi:hypothetical protein
MVAAAALVIPRDRTGDAHDHADPARYGPFGGHYVSVWPWVWRDGVVLELAHNPCAEGDFRPFHVGGAVGAHPGTSNALANFRVHCQRCWDRRGKVGRLRLRTTARGRPEARRAPRDLLSDLTHHTESAAGPLRRA